MDANTLKEQLSTEDVIHFVVEALGSNGNLWDSYGNPIFQTVCHNPPGTGSYKLYYYTDTKTFVCYTECVKITGKDGHTNFHINIAQKLMQ